MTTNEQSWIELFTNHPDFIYVIAYLLHDEYLDCSFIHYCLNDASLHDKKILISGLNINDKVSKQLIEDFSKFKTKSTKTWPNLVNIFSAPQVIFDWDIHKILVSRFGEVISTHLNGIIVYSIENRKINLDLLVVHQSMLRKGIGSQLVSRLKYVVGSMIIPQAYIFVVASNFLNKNQWGKYTYIIYTLLKS